MSINKRNSEGYFDPTAYKALAKIEREAKTHAFRPMVYICSPLSGNIAANQKNARRYHLVCAHCGQPFDSYGNDHRKYCSRSCYDAARRKGVG